MYHVGRLAKTLRKPRRAIVWFSTGTTVNERLLGVGASRAFPVDGAIGRTGSRECEDDLLLRRTSIRSLFNPHAQRIIEASRRRRLIVIDPRLSNTSARLTCGCRPTRHRSRTPARDRPHLITTGQVHRDFVRRWVNGDYLKTSRPDGPQTFEAFEKR